jgi:hypothetical protein
MALNKPISVFERLIGVLVSKLLKFSKLPNRTIRRQELLGRGDPNLRSQACWSPERAYNEPVMIRRKQDLSGGIIPPVEL